MGKACFLLLVLFLTACAPTPITINALPTPVLAEEHHGSLTMVEFFGVT